MRSCSSWKPLFAWVTQGWLIQALPEIRCPPKTVDPEMNKEDMMRWMREMNSTGTNVWKGKEERHLNPFQMPEVHIKDSCSTILLMKLQPRSAIILWRLENVWVYYDVKEDWFMLCWRYLRQFKTNFIYGLCVFVLLYCLSTWALELEYIQNELYICFTIWHCKCLTLCWQFL